MSYWTWFSYEPHPLHLRLCLLSAFGLAAVGATLLGLLFSGRGVATQGVTSYSSVVIHVLDEPVFNFVVLTLKQLGTMEKVMKIDLDPDFVGVAFYQETHPCTDLGYGGSIAILGAKGGFYTVHSRQLSGLGTARILH
ncbi:MAG: hypothetical protein IPH85_00105 [Ignavibacteria bacterium]|nr:hypothetical protein [Ignavibacteria bacterium]